MHALDDPLNKMQRANEHLQELDREISLYQAAHTYSVTKELNGDKTSYIYRIKPNVLPSLRIGTIIGDIIHNMRSALDHLAWQLALLATPTPYEYTAFPIYKDGTNKHIKDARRMLRDVPTEALDLIERLQPYHAGDTADKHPLWILHALWNLDKHRTLVPMAHTGWVPVFFGPGGSHDALDDGTIVVTVPVEVDAKLNLQAQVTADIAFPLDSPGRGMEVRELLRAIYKALDDIIFPALSRFFPEEEPPQKLRVTLVRQDEPPSAQKR
jgi:hypothetical protein